MRKGNINEHALGFGDAVTHGKVSEQAIETSRNRVQSKIGQPAFSMIKSLTD